MNLGTRPRGWWSTKVTQAGSPRTLDRVARWRAEFRLLKPIPPDGTHPNWVPRYASRAPLGGAGRSATSTKHQPPARHIAVLMLPAREKSHLPDAYIKHPRRGFLSTPRILLSLNRARCQREGRNGHLEVGLRHFRMTGAPVQPSLGRFLALQPKQRYLTPETWHLAPMASDPWVLVLLSRLASCECEAGQGRAGAPSRSMGRQCVHGDSSSASACLSSPPCPVLIAAGCRQVSFARSRQRKFLLGAALAGLFARSETIAWRSHASHFWRDTPTGPVACMVLLVRGTKSKRCYSTMFELSRPVGTWSPFYLCTSLLHTAS